MVKRVLMGLTAALFLFTSAGLVMALEKGNNRKGKYTYRKVYQSCMARGQVDSPKPPVNPDAKTRAEWTQVFENKDFAAFGCKQEWDNLSETDLMDIYAYLFEYAADSPTPAKCK